MQITVVINLPNQSVDTGQTIYDTLQGIQLGLCEQAAQFKVDEQVDLGEIVIFRSE